MYTVLSPVLIHSTTTERKLTLDVFRFVSDSTSRPIKFQSERKYMDLPTYEAVTFYLPKLQGKVRHSEVDWTFSEKDFLLLRNYFYLPNSIGLRIISILDMSILKDNLPHLVTGNFVFIKRFPLIYNKVGSFPISYHR